MWRDSSVSVCVRERFADWEKNRSGGIGGRDKYREALGGEEILHIVYIVKWVICITHSAQGVCCTAARHDSKCPVATEAAGLELSRRDSIHRLIIDYKARHKGWKLPVYPALIKASLPVSSSADRGTLSPFSLQFLWVTRDLYWPPHQ